MLLSAELASMRETMEASFPQTATVSRATRGAATGQGGKAITWADVGTYACRLNANGRPMEIAEGGQIVSVLAWTALLPHDADVNEKDRLVVAGVTYEVMGTDAAQPERIALTVTLRKVS